MNQLAIQLLVLLLSLMQNPDISIEQKNAIYQKTMPIIQQVLESKTITTENPKPQPEASSTPVSPVPNNTPVAPIKPTVQS